MKFLLDIPFVMNIAAWIWGGDNDEIISPELCVEQFPFMTSTECWSRLIAKCVGIGIIVLSCLNKAPVMKNIIATKSTAGLSRAAVYGETIVYANCAFYGILEKHPISNYGENVSMLIQSIIILCLIWSYSDNNEKGSTASNSTSSNIQRERIIAVSLGIVYLFVVTMILPSNLHSVLMASVYPILLYSRGTQIYTTFRLGHTGTLSIITTSMSFVGSCVRILTTIKEVGWDMNVLNGFFLSVTLNFILFVQYWYYRQNTIQFMKDLDESKKKKEL